MNNVTLNESTEYALQRLDKELINAKLYTLKTLLEEKKINIPDNIKSLKELKKYGFKVVRKVSTGHHAERFPIAKAKNLQPSSLGFSLLTGISHCFSLGDTFETYCIKVGEPQEKKAEDKK